MSFHSTRNGYGLETYGSSIYGRTDRVLDASATISASTTTNASCRVTSNVSPTISATLSATAIGFTSIESSARSTLSLSTKIEYIRVRNVSGSAATNAEILINSRYKWIDIPEPTTPTWVEADYREGAARHG